MLNAQTSRQFSVTSFITLCASLWCPQESLADPIRAKLDLAIGRHESTIADAARELRDAVEKRIIEAKTAGDAAAIRQFEAELAAFARDERRLPACTSQAARKYEIVRLRAVRDIVQAYEQAAQAYEKSAQLDRAEDLQEELQHARQRELEAMWRDLRPSVDLPRHALNGAWHWNGASLTNDPPASNPHGGITKSTLRLPVPSAKAYELEIVARRVAGAGPLQVAFRVPDGAALLTLGGWGGKTSGIGLIEGKDADANGTSHVGEVFAADEPATVLVRVSPAGVDVEAGDDTIVSWSGEWSALSLPKDLTGPLPQLVAAADTHFELHSLRFRELLTDDEPEANRKLDQPKAAAKPPAAQQPAARNNDPWQVGSNWQGSDNFNQKQWTFEVTQRVGNNVTLTVTRSDDWKCEVRGQVKGKRFVAQTVKRVGRKNKLELKTISGAAAVNGKTLAVSFKIYWDRGQRRINNIMQIRVARAQ